jgi:hypothetical protein
MKKYVMLAVATVFMCNMIVNGQDQQKAPKKEKNKKEFKENERPLPSAQQRTDRMAKELSLTDEEKAKVQALFEKRDARVKNHEAEIQKMREEQKEKFEAERKDQDAELEKIIGKEKFQQLEKTRTARLEKMNQKKEKMQGDSTRHKNKMPNEKRILMPNK